MEIEDEMKRLLNQSIETDTIQDLVDQVLFDQNQQQEQQEQEPSFLNSIDPNLFKLDYQSTTTTTTTTTNATIHHHHHYHHYHPIIPNQYITQYPIQAHQLQIEAQPILPTTTPIPPHQNQNQSTSSIPNSLSTLLQDIQDSLPTSIPDSKPRSEPVIRPTHIQTNQQNPIRVDHDASEPVKNHKPIVLSDSGVEESDQDHGSYHHSKVHTNQTHHRPTPNRSSKHNSHHHKPSTLKKKPNRSSKPNPKTKPNRSFPAYPKVGERFANLNDFKFVSCQAAWSRGHHIHVRSRNHLKNRITYACYRDRLPPHGDNCGFRLMISTKSDEDKEWIVEESDLNHTFHVPKPGDYLPKNAQKVWFDRMKVGRQGKGDGIETEEEEENEEEEEEQEEDEEEDEDEDEEDDDDEGSEPAIKISSDEEEIKEIDPKEWKTPHPKTLDQLWSFGRKSKKKMGRKLNENEVEKSLKYKKQKVVLKNEEEEEDEDEIEVISGCRESEKGLVRVGNGGEPRRRILRVSQQQQEEEDKKKKSFKIEREKKNLKIEQEKKNGSGKGCRMIEKEGTIERRIEGVLNSKKRRRKVILESDDDDEVQEIVKLGKVGKVKELDSESVDLDEDLWSIRKSAKKNRNSNSQSNSQSNSNSQENSNSQLNSKEKDEQTAKEQEKSKRMNSIKEEKGAKENKKEKAKKPKEIESLESLLRSCHYNLPNLTNDFQILGINTSKELINLNYIGFSQIMKLILNRQTTEQNYAQNGWMKEVLWNRMRNRAKDENGKRDRIWAGCWCWPRTGNEDVLEDGRCRECKFWKKLD